MNAQIPPAASVRTRWEVAARISRAEQEQLATDSLLLAQLLWNRGVRTASQAVSFLAPPDAAALADPARMRGVPEATERLLRAVRLGEPIAVYGDYDVDGLAGAALLTEALQTVGAVVTVYLPHRARDGYGLNAGAIRSLAEQGVRVVATVDCGTTNNEEVELAAHLGMDVIVTDHHAVPAKLPSALALLNPHQPGCSYPYKDLSGGGVALQLARALLSNCLPEPEADLRAAALADLAALSTVADVVPLLEENRCIVGLGLAQMRAQSRPGLTALVEMAGRAPEELTTRDLSFSLIPRLNAAGRMGDARHALDLLLARDRDAAWELAQRLETLNADRRAQMDDLLVALDGDPNAQPSAGAVVVDGPYPIGLAGLLATRLVDRWQVPSAVIQEAESVCRGSVRCAEGANVLELLGQCGPWLLQFGGHPRAAGFTLLRSAVKDFRAAFCSASQTALGERVPEKVVHVDAILRLDAIRPALTELLRRLEPTGEGNPPPMFLSRVVVRSSEPLGEGHLQLRVSDSRATRRGVAFRPAFTVPASGSQVEILYELGHSVWHDQQRVELMVRDLRLVSGAQAEADQLPV